MQQAGHADRCFRDVSEILSVGTISISPRPTVPTNPLSYARDGRRQGRGCLGPLASLRSRSLTCGNAPRKLLILVVIYPVERVDKASPRVPLLWPGTDVLLDSGGEHGGIVPLGTDGDA